MRLPNGFGTVYKLSGNRRRPFVVKKTISGKQKPLGYFETHNAALTFLLKVNHEPHGLTATFADIYQQWQVAKWPTISRSSQQAYDISYRHLSRLHDKTMSQLKYLDLQEAMDAVLKQLSMHHSPHECRHTLASMLDSAGVNDTVVKMILGHARRGVTKSVYTHKTLRELRKAVDIL